MLSPERNPKVYKPKMPQTTRLCFTFYWFTAKQQTNSSTWEAVARKATELNSAIYAFFCLFVLAGINEEQEKKKINICMWDISQNKHRNPITFRTILLPVTKNLKSYCLLQLVYKTKVLLYRTAMGNSTVL